MRYHPAVCNACGVELVSSPPFSLPDDYQFKCPECEQHYCIDCFYWHMLLGHNASMEQPPDLFTFNEEQ